MGPLVGGVPCWLVRRVCVGGCVVWWCVFVIFHILMFYEFVKVTILNVKHNIKSYQSILSLGVCLCVCVCISFYIWILIDFIYLLIVKKLTVKLKRLIWIFFIASERNI